MPDTEVILVGAIAIICALGGIFFIFQGPSESSLDNISSLIEAQSFEKANRELKLYLEKNDQDSQAWNLYGLTYFRMNNLDEALNCYDKSLSINPSQCQTLYNKASVLIKKGNSASEINNVLAFCTTYTSDHLPPLLLLAQQAFASKLYSIAKDSAQKVLSHNPDNEDMRYVAAMSSFAQQDYAASLAELNFLVKLNPDYPKVWERKGFVEYNLGQYGEAQKSFEKALEKDKNSVEAITNLAVVMYADKQYETALQHTQKAINIDNTYDFAWYQQSLILLEQGNGNEALLSINKAIRLNEKNPVYITSKGVVLAKLGRFDDALVAAQEALDIDAQYTDASILASKIKSSQ